jgi:hypothetical protein
MQEEQRRNDKVKSEVESGEGEDTKRGYGASLTPDRPEDGHETPR